MNQINQTETFEPVEDQPKPDAGAAPKPRLGEDEARALHRMLIQGNEALARRKDLGDMYKRIVATITTLDAGLTQRQVTRADEDRALLSARLEGMESAINSVEGVLRIELEPLVREAVNHAVAEQLSGGRAARPRRPFARRVIQLMVVCGAVYAGAAFSSQIKTFTQDASAEIFRFGASASTILSPDGGIERGQNQVE